MPQYEIATDSTERKRTLSFGVTDVEDGQESYGSRRAFSPQHIYLTFQQNNEDPLVLWQVTVRGPRRLKNGELSTNSSVDLNSYFWTLERHELDELDHKFPTWVRALVEEYWPESL